MPKSLPGPGPAPAHRDRLQGVESRRALRVPVSVGYRKEDVTRATIPIRRVWEVTGEVVFVVSLAVSQALGR